MAETLPLPTILTRETETTPNRAEPTQFVAVVGANTLECLLK